MDTDRKDVARAYIVYRNERSKIRSRNTNLMKNIEEKLMATNVQNQNANLDEHSFGGRMGEARSELMKDYAINYLLSDMARNNHLNNQVYVHDLDSYAVGMHNCLTIPFDDLLANGFNTRQTDVRPANSVNTAFQLIAVLFQLQSLQQFGGVSASHIDWTMVPYVRKSFRKHFNDGLKYIEEVELPTQAEATEVSITDESYTSHPKAYKYAMVISVWILSCTCLTANFKSWNSCDACSSSRAEFAVYSPIHTVDDLVEVFRINHRVVLLVVFRVDFYSL